MSSASGWLNARLNSCAALLRKGAAPFRAPQRAVHLIEDHPDAQHTLASLARETHLSPYHFLRIFERVTGVTPHQYVLRARLRDAAIRLAAEPKRILDIALDCGFVDVSNFNRAFRAEFGVSPRVYRSANVRHGTAVGTGSRGFRKSDGLFVRSANVLGTCS